MDALLVPFCVFVVPILVGGALAAWTGLPRVAVALIGGVPLPLFGLIVVLVDYIDVLHIPAKQCGFGCSLDRSLAPTMMMVAGGAMVVAFVIALITATIVRRRR